MIDVISNSIKVFDKDLTLTLTKFYEPYIPFSNPPFFARQLTLYTKVITYSLFLMLPLLLLKFVFPYREKVNLLIYAVLVVSGLALFGVFAAFIQLTFTF